jgi:hypothetical protein
LIANWTFIRPDDLQLAGERVGRGPHRCEHVGPRVCGGITIAASPEWTPGELDVLEHPADDARLAVAEAVDVELDRVLEELVDQDGLARHDLEHLRTTARSSVLAVDDEHAAAAEDEGGPQEHRVADLAARRPPPRPR